MIIMINADAVTATQLTLIFTISHASKLVPVVVHAMRHLPGKNPLRTSGSQVQAGLDFN